MNHHKFLMIYMLKYQLNIDVHLFVRLFINKLCTVIQDNIRLNIIYHQQQPAVV